MASVLVTGGLGFIGRHLCERLLQEGHAVLAVDDCSRPHAVEIIGPLAAWRGFRWAQADVVTMPRFPDPVPQPEVVIHLAARAGVRASLADPCAYVRTNVEGTTTVLECARRAGVSRIIFASSSSVYGHPGLRSAASREDDVLPPPLSPYAATKQAGELVCQTYAHLYGMNITALRFFSVYGPRQRPDLVLPTFARQMRAGEPVRVFGDGTALRDYTYIDDIVEGVCLALAALLADVEPHGHYACYNLGSGRPIPLATVIEALQAALDLPHIAIDYLPASPAEAAWTHADIRKAQAVLGYHPHVEFAEGVQRYVDWLIGPFVAAVTAAARQAAS